MRTIPLTRGYFSIVDDEDYDFLIQWNWYAVVSKIKNNIKVYAARNPGCGGNSKYFLMHRVVVNAPKGVRVDHRDRNTLNNCRGNLRLCSHSQNLQNTGLCSTNTSGLKGVSIHPQTGLWRARYVLNRKEHHIGLFKSKEEAARAYDFSISEVRGEFSVTNKTLGTLNVD